MGGLNQWYFSLRSKLLATLRQSNERNVKLQA
jgi:hypothetical protein